MGHKNCSCHICNRRLLTKSLKILINLGYRFDQLYFGQSLPASDRKLLRKLPRYDQFRNKLLSSGIAYYTDTKKSKKICMFDKIIDENPGIVRKTRKSRKNHPSAKSTSVSSGSKLCNTNSIASGLKSRKHTSKGRQNVLRAVQCGVKQQSGKECAKVVRLSNEDIIGKICEANQKTAEIVSSETIKKNPEKLQHSSIREETLKNLIKPLGSYKKINKTYTKRKIICYNVKHKKDQRSFMHNFCRTKITHTNLETSKNVSKSCRLIDQLINNDSNEHLTADIQQKYAIHSKSLREMRQIIKRVSKCNIAFHDGQITSGGIRYNIGNFYSDSNGTVQPSTKYILKKQSPHKISQVRDAAGHMSQLLKKHNRKFHKVTVVFFTFPEDVVNSVADSANISRELHVNNENNNERLSIESSFLIANSLTPKEKDSTQSKKSMAQIKANPLQKPFVNKDYICTDEFSKENLKMLTGLSREKINRPIEQNSIHETIHVNKTRWFQRIRNYFRRYFSCINLKNLHKSANIGSKKTKYSEHQSQLNTSSSFHEYKTQSATDSSSSIVTILFKNCGSKCNNLTTSKSSLANIKVLNSLPNIRQTYPTTKKYPTSPKKTKLLSKLKKCLIRLKFQKMKINNSMSIDTCSCLHSNDSTALTSKSQIIYTDEALFQLELADNKSVMNCDSTDLFNQRKKNTTFLKSFSSSAIPYKNTDFYCYVATSLERHDNFEDSIQDNLTTTSSSSNFHDLNNSYNNYDVMADQSVLQYYNALKNEINRNEGNLSKSVTKAELVENILFPTKLYIDKTTSLATNLKFINEAQNSTFCSKTIFSDGVKEKITNYNIKNAENISLSKHTIGSQTINRIRHYHLNNNNLYINNQKIFQFLAESFNDHKSLSELFEKKSYNDIMLPCSCTQFPSKYNLKGRQSRQGKLQCFEIEHFSKSAETNDISKGFSRSLTGISKYLKKNFYTLTLEDKKHRVKKNECEPDFCVVDECDPNECLKRINQRNAKYRDRGTGGSIASSIIRQRGRKRRQMDDEREYPSEYIVEEPRALKNIVQTLGPRRQAVKIGSSFSFNIEFYKERKDGICFKQPVRRPVQRPKQPPPPPPPPPQQRRVKKQAPPRRQRSASTFTTDTRDYRDTGTIDEGPYREHREIQAVNDYRESGAGRRKPCYCTAKLQARPGRMRGTTASTATVSTFADKHTGTGNSKYACDKGLCTSGLCDPKKCLEKKLGARRSTSSIGSVTVRRQRGSIGSVTLPEKRVERGVKVRRAKRRHHGSKSIETSVEPRHRERGVQKMQPEVVRRRRYVQRYGQPLQYIEDQSDSCSGSRQAVKVGSSFDFNVEFFKDKSDSSGQHVQFAEPDYSDDDRNYRRGHYREGHHARNFKSVSQKVRATMTNPIKRCFCTLKLQKQAKGQDNISKPVSHKDNLSKPVSHKNNLSKPASHKSNASDTGKRGKTRSTAAYFCKCKYGPSNNIATDHYTNMYQIKRKKYMRDVRHHSLINCTCNSSSLSIQTFGGYRASINCDPLSCFEFSDTSSNPSIVTILPYRSKKHNKQCNFEDAKNKKIVRDQSTTVEDKVKNVDPKIIAINVSCPNLNKEKQSHPYITIDYDKINIKVVSRHTRTPHLNVTRLHNIGQPRRSRRSFRHNHNVPVVAEQPAASQFSVDLDTRNIDNNSVQFPSNNTTITICFDNDNNSNTFEQNTVADNSNNARIDAVHAVLNRSVLQEIRPIQSEIETTGLLDRILNEIIFKDTSDFDKEIERTLRKTKSDFICRKPNKDTIKRRYKF